MSGPDDTYPRAVFDAHGTYTVRTGASYCVEDSRVRELAEIGYARRDVAKAYDFLTRCLDDNDSADSNPRARKRQRVPIPCLSFFLFSVLSEDLFLNGSIYFKSLKI